MRKRTDRETLEQERKGRNDKGHVYDDCQAQSLKNIGLQTSDHNWTKCYTRVKKEKIMQRFTRKLLSILVNRPTQLVKDVHARHSQGAPG